METNTNQQVSTKQPSNLKPWQDALVKAEGKFLAIVGKEAETKIELGFAAMLMEANPALKDCEPASIMNAVINVARTGTTLNPILKLCHLIPRGKKCVLEFDYKGLVKVLKDNRCIRDIQAIIVYEDEKYEEGGSAIEKPTHEKRYAKTEAEQLKREYKGVYCQVLLPDNTVIYTPFTPYWEILKAEKVSQSANSSYSPWKNWRESMIMKTKIKKDFKTLISGTPDNKVLAALSVDEENNGADFSKQNKQQKQAVNSKTLNDLFCSEDVEYENVHDQAPETKSESMSPNTDFINAEADKQQKAAKGRHKKQVTEEGDMPSQEVMDMINKNEAGKLQL